MQGVDKVKIFEREEIIDILTKKLPILRASIGISQTELSEYIGISRQTYNTFETGKRKMSWSIFLTLFLFFISNTSSYELLKTEKGYVARVYRMLQHISADSTQQTHKIKVCTNNQDNFVYI